MPHASALGTLNPERIPVPIPVTQQKQKYPPSRLRGLKPGGHNRGKPNPNAGRKPLVVHERAAWVLATPEGWQQFQEQFKAGKLHPAVFKTLAEYVEPMTQRVELGNANNEPFRWLQVLLPPESA